MEINLLQLFGTVPGIPLGAKPEVPGGFAEFLQAASPPNWPPGIAKAIPTAATTNENGKELSIQPNARETELDPDSKSPSTADAQLACQMFAGAPIVVLSSEASPNPEFATPIKTTRQVIPAWSPSTSNSLPSNWQVPELTPRSQTRNQISIPAFTSWAVAIPQAGVMPSFEIINPNPRPEIPTIDFSQPFGPQIGNFMGFDRPKVVPQESPAVAISGLVRNEPASVTLDPKMIETLGVVAMEGSGFAEEAIPANTPPEVPVETELPTPSRSVTADQANPVKNPVQDQALATFTQLIEGKRVEGTRVQQVVASPPKTDVVAVKAEPRAEKEAIGKEILTDLPDEPAAPMLIEKEEPTSIELAHEPIDEEGPEVLDVKTRPAEEPKAATSSVATLHQPQERLAETKASRPSGLAPVEQRQVLEQTIERLDRMAIHRPLSQMVIRLMPKELGEITLTVKSVGSRSEATVEATDPRVAQALQVEQPKLQQTIEAKGFSLSSLTFQFNDRSHQEAPHTETPRPMASSSEQDVPPTNSPNHTISGSDNLNLVI
ncbi:MAG: flagellar hook-length control protein FliK [Chthonomonas sp.]|nr:flagellar hook-length control protein FliK [Chthonomonas sp.]